PDLTGLIAAQAAFHDVFHLGAHADHVTLLRFVRADPDTWGFAHPSFLFPAAYMPQPLAATMTACWVASSFPLFIRASAYTVCDCDKRTRTAASAVPAACVKRSRQASGDGFSAASTMISSHQSCSVMGRVTLTFTGTALGLSASMDISSFRPAFSGVAPPVKSAM